MNYVTQLNTFFRVAGSLELNSPARILYLSLLNKNNSLAWIKSFTCTASELESLSGLSTSGLQRARKQLVEKRIINYVKRGSNKAPRYSIPELTNDFVLTILNDTPNNTPVNTPNNTANDTPNTLTKTKQTKTKQDDYEAYRNLITMIQQNFGINSTKPLMQDDLKYTLEDFTKQGTSYIEAVSIVEYALTIAVTHQGNSWAYVKGIINRWTDQSLFTMAEIKEYQEKPKQNKNGSGQDEHYNYDPIF
ncbi:DnaD domain protein [Companilactobacillus zhachilii]|uniref:DnaD domain protein n=1 Tax=Companilactobacillus zhachilii TaxID=2304606 RepID=UPI0040339991